MDVELLVVADCPNEILAAALLRTALACRVYPGPSGIPDLQTLRQVMKQAAGTTDSPTGAGAAGKSVASGAC